MRAKLYFRKYVQWAFLILNHLKLELISVIRLHQPFILLAGEIQLNTEMGNNLSKEFPDIEELAREA